MTLKLTTVNGEWMYGANPVREDVSLAGWTRTIRRSALQDMLDTASRPGIISFALGLPAPDLFPAREYAKATERVLASDPCALQYGPPFQPLKAQITALMKERGVICREEQILLTAGAQQGMNLLARLLLDPHGQVLTEQMAYTGFQQVIEPFEPEILAVPTDLESGIDVDAVESLLGSGVHPAFIYAVTDGHNPLGVSMSEEKRTRLAELARNYRVPIIEDDAYGFIYFGETALPPLKALDSQWVYYVGSFSKILAPGLRVGWIIVPESLIPKLSIVKEATDIDTSTLAQRTISAYLDGRYHQQHLIVLRSEYKKRRDAMMQALGTHFPDDARYMEPTSGVFIWVELPERVDAGDLLKAALQLEQVAFIPGLAFSVGPIQRGASSMRLNFSHCRPELIEEGISKLARALKNFL